MSRQISSTHPALSGHFPGHPVVPAVVILEQLRQVLLVDNADKRISRIPQCKFLQPLLPEQPFNIEFTCEDMHCRFKIISMGQLIAQGELELEDLG
jgi:3-hydroxymyristoyl/3-hydroxydecanoyl-(acyl carrier protein) dehydratase